ncbi:MAG: Smr/MutS family protein [Spirochaetaceae bacterium]|jgi:DNA-nicking Smr family endonuclease|nr:Smr/MutS family protein [Spirochaetaceae bacterium]
MDFAKILAEWEENRTVKAGSGKKRTANDALCAWLERNTPVNKDAEFCVKAYSPAEKQRLLLNIPPEASIDLHEKTRDEAWRALDDFFHAAVVRGVKKVLIIHGKGNHSKTGGVLKEICRVYLEQCPFAGASGHPSGKDGGTGATWVILKEHA